jgi:polysaccharide biosynthesis/export protein
MNFGTLRSTTPALGLAALALAAGCTPASVASPKAAMAAAIAPPAAAAGTTEPLGALFAQRHDENNDKDYVVGEGDVLAVKAFDMDELNQRVRVDGEGSVTLPLLNTVKVAGQTVSQVQQDLTKRLGEFMYDPHVSVFVEEYRSQLVSVLGAVQRPGPVSQIARNTTVREALSSAGGTTAEAGTRYYLLPAENRALNDAQAAERSILDGSGVSGGQELANAIMVDTQEMDADTQRRFFNLPVRGGDVVIVPQRGKFILEGWVEKPGTYPLNPGLTIRGAIATGGGLQFAASEHDVRIYRPGPNGQTQMTQVNYAQVSSLRSPDVYIHDGDVVRVSYSAAKLPPYLAYKVVADLFHLGLGVKMAP